MLFAGKRLCEVWQKIIDNSEECAERLLRESLVYYCTLKMEAITSSKTSDNFYKSAWLVALYGYKNESLMSGEEHRLGTNTNRVLK
jgi:hypothetical protein